MITEKKCTNKNCEMYDIFQPISNFDKNKNKPDGFNNWCKKCKHQQYLKNKKNILDKLKKRNMDP